MDMVMKGKRAYSTEDGRSLVGRNVVGDGRDVVDPRDGVFLESPIVGESAKLAIEAICIR
jgi:hypothetical protein